jgi:hypothetical protein
MVILHHDVSVRKPIRFASFATFQAGKAAISLSG